MVQHWYMLPRKDVAYPFLEIHKPDWTWPWATCYDWPCWKLGWGWTAPVFRPFPEVLSNLSPPGKGWLIVWCLSMLDRHSFSVFIPIKLQNYHVHHFPAQDLLSLTAGSGEKRGGERAFSWAVGAGRHQILILVTGCSERGSTQPQWLQGNSDPGKQREIPQEGELCHRFLLQGFSQLLWWILSGD